MTLRDRVPMAVMLITALIIPLYFQPFRYDVVFAHQTAATLILVLMALPFCWHYLPRLSGTGRWMAGAIYAWGAVVLITSVLALSPMRALVGDVDRQMGVWTQLVLLSAVLLSPWLIRARVWRWYWLAVILVGLHAVLEATGSLNIVFGRPKGLLGWTTFTAPWLSLAMLWAGLGFFAYEWATATRWQKIIYALGLLIGVGGLIALAARAAIILLAVGVVTAGLTWTALYGYWRVALAIMVAVILGSGLLAYLSTINNQQGIFAQNLISRIQVDPFREYTWARTLELWRDPPALENIHGEPDQWRSLRPVVGYGLDNFEFPYYLKVDAGTLSSGVGVDRAHNEWLDTLLMTGLVGLVVRVVLWASAIWLALSRLGLADWRAGLAILFTCGAAFVITRNDYYLPLAVTLTALFTLWLYLLLRAIWQPVRVERLDQVAWLALAIITAHIIGLQFNFVLLSTDWLAWLVLGVLLVEAPAENTASEPAKPARPIRKSLLNQSQEPGQLTWLWAGLLGAALIRWWAEGTLDSPRIIVLLMVMVAAAVYINPMPRPLWPTAAILILVLWGYGYLGFTLDDPALTGWWDMAFLVIALALLSYDYGSLTRRFTPPAFSWRWSYVLLILAAFFFWERDIRADAHTELGLLSSDLPTRLDHMHRASTLTPWEEGIVFQEVQAALIAGIAQNDQMQLAALPDMLARSENLNSYDPNLALAYVALYLKRAEDANATAENLERADRYFAAASRLSPNYYLIEREWARYWLFNRQDAATAKAHIETALRLYPADEQSRQLQAQIDAQLASGE